MRFKKFLSCLLVSSLVNVNFIWAIPGKDSALVALEERTQAGWQKFKHLQQRIIEITQAKPQEICDPSLAKDMAEISGPFMEKYVISQEMARKILSIDEVGDIKRENDKGTSPVKRVENVFFKTDGRHFNPDKPNLSPALENAAYWFYHIVFGEGATPTSLITVNNVLIKRAPYSLLEKFGDLFKSYQLCRDNRQSFPYFFKETLKKGISQEALDQFKNSFEDSHESFIIQASLGVGSEGLDDFIIRMNQEPKSFNELNKKDISIHFLTSILLNLSDAKADNFRVDNGAIIGIDNDRFFAPDIFRQYTQIENENDTFETSHSTTHRVGVRSIFYCWKDVLNIAIDRSVKNIISSNDPMTFINQWLNQLYLYDNELMKLKDNGALKSEWFEIPNMESRDQGTQLMIKLNLVSDAPVFPLYFPKKSIISLLSKFNVLHNKLLLQEDITHKGILTSIQPNIMMYYDKLMEKDLNSFCNEIMALVYDGSSYEYLKLGDLIIPDLTKEINKPRGIISIKEATLEITEYLNQEIIESVKSNNISILSLVEKGLLVNLFKTLIDAEKINVVDQNNQGLVHKAVLSAKVDVNNAKELLEILKSMGANLDLNAQGKSEKAGTPLTQAMLLEDKFAISIFNKLIELGAGFDTDYSVAEKFINKNKDKLSKSSKLKQRVETLLRRDPNLHWNLSLNKLLPIVNDPKAKGIIIKISNGQERFLSEELAETMLNKKGNLANQTTYGRRDVVSIKTDDNLYGIYFKAYPELPGVEEQVGRLTRMLLGYGAPYTELASYKGIPLLLSQAIIGKNLQDVLREDPKILDKLDHKSLSGMMLLSILTNPEDGKPDNYIVEPIPGNTESYRLVCVDNDHAFVQSVAKEQNVHWYSAHSIIQVRSILYCLDQMKSTVHQDIRDLFIKLDAAKVLRNWLEELKTVNDRYAKLFSAEDTRNFLKKHECFIGVPFKENMVPELYQKFLRLKDALEESASITHLDLLMKLEPMLGKRYLQVLNKPMTAKERFDEVDGIFYSQSLTGSHGTLITSTMILQSMKISTKKNIINELRSGKRNGAVEAKKQLDEAENKENEKALYNKAIAKGAMADLKNLRSPEILEQILEGIDFSTLHTTKEQALIKFLKNLPNKLESLRKLYLKGSKVLVDGDLTKESLGIGNITILDISKCTNLTQNIFAQISKECPGIRKLLASGIGDKNHSIREIVNKESRKFIGGGNEKEINYPHLEKLDISDLPNLGYIKLNSPILKILEVNNCPKFSLIKSSLLNITQLIKLEIQNNQLIKESEIIDLLINHPSINHLNLVGCANIKNPDKYKDRKILYGNMLKELGINEKDKCVKLESKDLQTIQILAISSLTNLTNLNLWNNQIDNKMAKYISCLTNLKSLDLRYNKIREEGAINLSTLINLSSLNLWNNQIGDAGVQALSILTNLTFLDISSNYDSPYISDNGVQSISSLRNLSALYISHNSVGDDGVKSFSYLTNLNTLNLWNNQVGDKGAKSIALLTQLRSLDLSENQIGDEEVKFLAYLTKLTFLNLGGNSVGNNGIMRLSCLINLKHLDLSENQIGDEGSKSLTYLNNLNYLDISYNQLTDEGAKFISCITSLTCLDLSFNEIGYEGATSLLSLLNLISIDLRSNHLEERILQNFKSIVQQNKAKALPAEDKDFANAIEIRNEKETSYKNPIQDSWSIIQNNFKINLKNIDNPMHQINEEDFNKINITKPEWLNLSINIIKQNIDITSIAGRQLQTLLGYYNQAAQDLSTLIKQIDPSNKSKASILYQAQSLIPHIGVSLTITADNQTKERLISKVKQMKEVMDLLHHYLENNPNVCKSIILYTLKHLNRAIYQEYGNLDNNFFELYSKLIKKPVIVWKEKTSRNEEKNLELVYPSSNNDDPRKSQNFLYNPSDDSLTPLEVVRP